MTLTSADYLAGRKAFEAWLGKPWPSWSDGRWFENVITRLVRSGAVADKTRTPSDATYRDAADLVNAEYGSPAYQMPGAKTTIPIRFIAALLDKPVTGNNAADIAAAEERGYQRGVAAAKKKLDEL